MMSFTPDELTSRQKLREDAEKMVASLSPKPDTAQPNEILLHELLVHKIELETQNEELRKIQLAIEQTRDRYQDLYEFAPVGYVTLTRDGIISEANLTVCTLLGIDRQMLLNQRFANFIANADKDRWHRLFVNMMAFAKGDRKAFDFKMLNGKGAGFEAHLDCLRNLSLDELPSLRITLTDISESKRLEKETQLAAIAFESQECIFVTDADNIIQCVNTAFTHVTGYTSTDALGKPSSLLKSGRHDKAFYEALWDTLHATGSWQGEIWNRRKNGEIYPAWITITAIKNNDGKVSHYVASHIDIGQKKAAYEQIERLVFYDPLTHLANRRLLTDRLHLGVAASFRNKRYGALLFIDLDNFKLLNDTLGHNMGDLLLMQVAQRLTGAVREIDTVARLGGDEFVVMLEGLDERSEDAALSAEIVARKILAALNEPYHLAGHDYRCSASIGATLFYGYAVPEGELLKHVDIAMYQAKHNGRNGLCFFDNAMQIALNKRKALKADLRQALDNQEFIVYCQRQVNDNNQTIGAEFLLRWQHPTAGLLEPAQFLSLAEETGLILPIGQWILETACQQLQNWANHPIARGWVVAINISPTQFHSAEFVEIVLTLLDKFAIDPRKLRLELTESLVLINLNQSVIKMQKLRERGVRFSMDDFGTGYSSLSHLTQLPLDQLKIDRSFIEKMATQPTEALIVKTILAMAQTLGVEVIAEGVETTEQKTYLTEQGCCLFQGFLFGEPVTLKNFEP